MKVKQSIVLDMLFALASVHGRQEQRIKKVQQFRSRIYNKNLATAPIQSRETELFDLWLRPSRMLNREVNLWLHPSRMLNRERLSARSPSDTSAALL